MINHKNLLKNIIVWDIETIPQIKMTEVQYEKLESKSIAKYEKSNKTESLQQIKNRLAATNPYFGQILVISLYEISNRFPNGFNKSIVAKKDKDTSEIDEKSLLKIWWKYIENFSGTFVGFNSLNFDAYYTIIRSMYHGITPTNKNFLNLRKFSVWPHYDIMQHLGNWGYETRPGLEQATDFFNIKSPKDGDIKGENVFQAFLDGRIDEIAHYCEKDVKATYELFMLTREYLPD
jgi:predicted PolB exonuclease-like 3'-5' exonuclease